MTHLVRTLHAFHRFHSSWSASQSVLFVTSASIGIAVEDNIGYDVHVCVCGCTASINRTVPPYSCTIIRIISVHNHFYVPMYPLRTILLNKIVVLVGRSGGGKSTVQRLLYRFYDSKSGIISIDGQNILDVKLQSLCSTIGIVPQVKILRHL